MFVLSFNSYKGGACRTTTCYNTLPYIAKKLGATSQQPILVFDVDLDSMGLTSLFNGKQHKGDAKPYSAKHLFADDEHKIGYNIRTYGLDQDDRAQKYYGYFDKVGKHLGLEDDGSVLFLGVDANANTISEAQFKNFEKDAPLNKLLQVFDEMPNPPKALVFDCAAGVQQTTLSVLREIKCSVMCMRPTTQFRIGTRDYLVDKISKKVSEDDCKVILLPTSVSQINISDNDPKKDDTKAKMVVLKNKAFREIEKEIVTYITKETSKGEDFGYSLELGMVDEENDIYGIPEIERFKWTEDQLLYKLSDDELTYQEKLLRSRYERLADIIAKNVSE